MSGHAKPWHRLPPRCCRVCDAELVQRPHETGYLFARREVCGRTCHRQTIMTPSQKGKLRWTQAT